MKKEYLLEMLKFCLCILFLSALLLFKEDASAQTLGSIRGKVTDNKDITMPGVSVKLEGAATQTQNTDANGNYSFTGLRAGNYTLSFNFIGFTPTTNQVTLAAGQQSVVNASLIDENTSLEEVVVVGYGTQKKTTLTGSVASVRGKEILKTPGTNLTNTIAGLLPGVVTKNTSGEPGRDNNLVLIRGSNTLGSTSPLIVVDGVQGASYERINSNDIESISVLKDAAAAIYGARAANGVILITTKRGTIGKPTISYSFNQGISQPTRLPIMASSAEFADYVNQLDIEAGNSPRYSAAEIQKFADGSDPNYINENWYTTSLKKNTLTEQHNLNVRGGSDNIKYSVSGSFSNEDGIFKQTSLNYKNYSIRSNVDAMINKYLNIGFDLNAGYENGNYPAGGSSFGGLKQIPFVPVFWPNGLPSAGIENGNNPIIQANAASGNEANKAYKFQAKSSFDLTIPGVKGLGVDGYFVYSNNITTNKLWQLPWEVYTYNKTTNVYTLQLGGRILLPQLSESYSGGETSLLNLRIKYALKTGNHNLSAFIAGEQSDGGSRSFSASRVNFVSNTIDQIFAGNLVNQTTGGTSSESGRQNLFGRVSYNFMEKYLLDFNARYDGSSNFPKGKQWGFFPGVSVAWRMSQENFMKKYSFINELKLRASVGKIGNDAISAFQNLRLYTIGNTGVSYGQAPVATQGLVQGVTPNPNITWEVATISNVGLDASLWNGLLGLEIDVFKQKRSNILAARDASIPAFTGLSLPNENIGIVQNEGFELQLSHSKRIGNISYRIAPNVAFARSKIIDIDEPQNVPAYQKREGHVIGASNYYQAIGIIRTQAQFDAVKKYAGTKIGDLYYEDTDGNGLINANDMVRTDKTNIPQMTFGAQLSMNYKSFSIWANFAGATRYWQQYHVNARIAINQLRDVIINRYRIGSMDSKYPRLPTLETQTEVSGLSSTFWLRDATYVKLKTLELSYMPQALFTKFKIQSFRIFVNGNNLFTIDRLKWNDPENSSNTNGNYPQQKIYNLGINLTF